MIRNFPNIINKDGEAHYFGMILNAEQIHNYFNELLHKIDWANEKLIMFGKEITTKRKVAFYADSLIEYTYSNKTKKGLEWTPLLIDIKQLVSSYTGSDYNACLLNLYHDGEEGMGWHSDDEKEIMPNSSIASLSLGAERKFAIKHKVSKEAQNILLENGSLLEMLGSFQKNWLHSMPKSKKIIAPRINLTFRQMLS
jgi:alkylated DNA repair dioxygenase AlkB